MDRSDGEIIEESNPGVKEVAKQWSVLEDGAYAYQLQEEENTTHFSGNISRRRTVRTDREVAKEAAKDAAIEAFREEHEIAERNRQLEEEDGERARQLQLEMMKEEQEKALQEVETDQLIAKNLQMEEKKEFVEHEQKSDELIAHNLQLEEKKKLVLQAQKSDQLIAMNLQMEEKKELVLQEQESDEMIARKLQMEEKRRSEKERRRRMQEEQEFRDAQLARRLSQQEGHHHQHQQHQARKHRSMSAHVEADHTKIDESMKAMSLEDAKRKHRNHDDEPRMPPGATASIHQPKTVALESRDSDEESDAIAKVTHDEMIARKLQREEVQRTRPRTLSEEQERQLRHDEKIARKMQHEEVMLAKKKTYERYKNRISNEVADPPPMVHVSKEKKVPVLAEAKESNGITLTDVNTPPSRVDTSQPKGGKADQPGNILTAIDPTYNPQANNNVVLTKRTPIGDAVPPRESPPPPTTNGKADNTPPDNFAAVQGTRRSSTKEKKRGSFFSKLKKK